MGIIYKETSAKTGKGIEKVFQGIYQDNYDRFKQPINFNNKDEKKESNVDKRINNLSNSLIKNFIF